MKYGIVGTSITALHHGIKLLSQGNRIEFLDSSSNIGGAWATRLIFDRQLEFAWHSLVANSRSKLHVEKVIATLAEYGAKAELIDSKYFLQQYLKKSVLTPLKSLEPSIPFVDIMSDMRRKHMLAGTGFSFNTAIKQIHVLDGKAITIDQEGESRIYDKIRVSGFCDIQYVNVGSKKIPLPGDPRIAVHAVIRVENLRSEIIPPLSVEGIGMSFDLIREISPCDKKKDGLRFLIVRISRNFKKIAIESGEKINEKVISDLKYIGLPIDHFNAEVKLQLYPIIYRSDQDVEGINRHLPVEVRLNRSQDLFDTLK